MPWSISWSAKVIRDAGQRLGAVSAALTSATEPNRPPAGSSVTEPSRTPASDRTREDAHDRRRLTAFIEGDVSAFHTLAERYEKPLVTYCSYMLRHDDAAKDATQEIFVKVIRNASSCHGAAVRSWIFAIARNHCLDELRRRRVKHQSLDETLADEEGRESPWVEQFPNPAVMSAERETASRHLRALITQAIEALPEEQREVFLLKEEAQLSFRELGAILSVPVDTVKSRMRYALKGLRRRLQQSGITPEDFRGWEPG